MSSFSEYTIKIRDALTNLYDNTIGRIIGKMFRRPSTIIFLGLDNAGKTTLVFKLKNGVNSELLPTLNPNEHSDVEVGNLKARIIDIGGHETARYAWKDYYISADGIVFIVDVADYERHQDVARAWKDVTGFAGDVPIVVLMNKIDMVSETPDKIESDENFIREWEKLVNIHKSENVKITYLSILFEDIFDKNSKLCTSFAWLGDKVYKKQ